MRKTLLLATVAALLATVAALLATPASAADMPRKAAPIFPALAASTCTLSSCIGWHVGFNVVNSGTGINVLNLGSLNANGTLLGLDGGYQYYNGRYWFGADVLVSYNVASSGNFGGLSNFFAVEGVELGGDLFGAFGLAPPQTNGFLSTLTTAIPTADIGACQHGRASGYCAGATLHYLLPNTPLELKLRYINAQYGTTSISAISTVNNENMVLFGGTYHF